MASAVKKSSNNNGIAKHNNNGRLLLNHAIKQAEQGSFEGWSEARVEAYNKIETNPNAYYYRFNAPGEEQATGPWSEV